jgi:pimeloyl-ACP methyl ester carboxylesterase
MLIHGAWLNSRSWEHWKTRYESAGYTVIAPDWPGDEGDPAELRAHPRESLTRFGPREIVDHYANQVRKLNESPILVGHSAGGVFVQHLLDRGYGVAGVAIHPAPTPGVRLGLDTVISALPVLGNPFTVRKVVHMSRGFFARRFANGLARDLVAEHYDRYIVPTAGKVYWDGVLSGGAGPITWRSAKRPPLLLIAGGLDKIAEPGMTRAIFEKQKNAESLTEFKLYPTRSHWTCVEQGWEEVADTALQWAERNARDSAVAH